MPRFVDIDSGRSVLVPGGLPYPVVSIQDYGAACNGSTDDTGAIQLALNAASAVGGMVLFPAGRETVLGGQLLIPSNTGIASLLPGPFDPSSLASVAPVVLVPNSSVSPFVFAGRNSFVSDILIHYPNQIVPTSVSTPVAYPPTFATAAGSAGNRVRRVTLTNAYQGFSLLGGRHLVEDIWAGCLSNVFTVDNSLDVVRIRRIQASPFWNTIAGLSYPQNIDTWVAANKILGIIYRADGLRLEDIFGFVGNVGLQMLDTLIGGLTPAPSYGDGSNIRFDTFTNGIVCQSTQGPGWQITNFSAGTSSNPIVMSAGGGTAPKLRINGGSFWGSNKVPLNTAGGLSIYNVENYNPIGGGQQPGVPASGSTVANNRPTPVVVYMTTGAGVTVSQVQIGTVVTNMVVPPSTTAMVGVLAPNQGITPTYTGGTPTWEWHGL